jgi:hypothetical protein
MLAQWVPGESQSWAIRWHASPLLKDRLTLYPGRALVCNIGLDGIGVHCGSSIDFPNELADSPIPVRKIPVKVNLFANRKVKYS